jgi:hypothetical protein
MKYTVVWSPPAQATLANLWLHAQDKQAVANASDRLEIALKHDPERKGRPFGKYFVREETPLNVLYQVDPGDCMVRIITVKRI